MVLNTYLIKRIKRKHLILTLKYKNLTKSILKSIRKEIIKIEKAINVVENSKRELIDETKCFGFEKKKENRHINSSPT